MHLQKFEAKKQRAVFEISVTLIPYFIFLPITCMLFDKNLLAFFLFAIMTSLFCVRLFSIFHDCSHRSFHPNQGFCLWMGRVCGFFSSFAPFSSWTRTHNSHHANLNNLDLKLPGDILIYTVDEFQKLTPSRKIIYRIYRHPVFLIGIGGFIYFLLFARIPWLFPERDRRSIWATNVGVCLFYFIGCTLFGAQNFLITQLLVLWIGTGIGVIIFYIHHQFEGSYFSRGSSWRIKDPSLKGSSYFRFPKIIDWFTMNIGYHHIHHLHPQIPGYFLPEVARANDEYSKMKPLGLKDLKKCFDLKLFCEKTSKLVPF